MPRPADELLAEIGRNWDKVKVGALQTPAQTAAREWLIQHTPMTLAQALAGTFEPDIGRDAGTGDKPAKTTEAAATEELDAPPKLPIMGSLAPTTQHLFPSELTSGSYASSVAVSPIGSLAIVLEGLIPSHGSARAAAREVSRLAGLLAEMTEGEADGDTAGPPAEPNNSIVAPHG